MGSLVSTTKAVMEKYFKDLPTFDRRSRNLNPCRFACTSPKFSAIQRIGPGSGIPRLVLRARSAVLVSRDRARRASSREERAEKTRAAQDRWRPSSFPPWSALRAAVFPLRKTPANPHPRSFSKPSHAVEGFDSNVTCPSEWLPRSGGVAALQVAISGWVDGASSTSFDPAREFIGPSTKSCSHFQDGSKTSILPGWPSRPTHAAYITRFKSVQSVGWGFAGDDLTTRTVTETLI